MLLMGTTIHWKSTLAAHEESQDENSQDIQADFVQMITNLSE